MTTHPKRGRFRVATINALGHSHTTKGSDKAKRGWLASYARTVLLTMIVRARRLDVVGLQEFQPEQRRVFVKRMGKKWGICPAGDNSVVWRLDTWQPVGSRFWAAEGEAPNLTVPYFGGKMKRMPVAVLRHLASGKLVVFASVHNPASVRGDALAWRKQGWQIEGEWAAKMLAMPGIAAVVVAADRNSPPHVFGPALKEMGGHPAAVPDLRGGIDWLVGYGAVEFEHGHTSQTKRIGRATDHPVTQAVGWV